MKDSIKNLLFLHGILLLYSVTGILSKIASKHEFLSVQFIILYGFMVFILFIYALLWQQVIKKMTIVVAYANKSVTVLWGILWGVLIFKEKVTLNNIIGAVMIIIGVIVMLNEKEMNE